MAQANTKARAVGGALGFVVHLGLLAWVAVVTYGNPVFWVPVAFAIASTLRVTYRALAPKPEPKVTRVPCKVCAARDDLKQRMAAS